jgi:hypothetical protein
MLLLSLLLAAPAATLPLEVAEVKAGLRGVCVTEWTDGERWEIPVEVMGVLEGAGPERTAVLVRFDDPRFAGSGVPAGMSGSPVYVEGRLLGAVAFGWAFAREPLAGVTPFTAMRRIDAALAPAGSPPPPTLQQLAALARGEGAPLSALPTLPRPPGWVPQPVAVAGLPAAGGFASELLDRAGLVAMPGAATGGGGGVPAAGEMAAALLVWGDATLAAGGTVTARDGDTLYAFGHPLLGLGAVQLPAARARVLAVQNSFQNPFKLFAVGERFGAFVADRPAGMVARVGGVPSGLPVSVTIRRGDEEMRWNFQVARLPLLEPLLAAFLVNGAFTARGAALGDATVRLALTATLGDGTTSAVTQDFTGTDALARTAAFTGAFLGFLSNSPFPHPPVTRLEVRAEHIEAPRRAAISQAYPRRQRVRPGDQLTVTVELHPEGGAPTRLPLRVRVPADTPPGRLDLVVADGAAWSAYALRANAIAPTSFAQQLAQVALLDTASTLVVALEAFEPGIAAPGASLPGLPPSWAATLAAGLSPAQATRLRTTARAVTRWQAPYPLAGAVRIPLTVEEFRERP